MTTVHGLVNEMIQLQELVVADMQKKVVMPSARLEELEHAIEALKQDLPRPVQAHFFRLLKKHPEAIVPVWAEACTGCGMRFTRSLANAVQRAEQLQRCPNCTRYLYFPDQMVERKRRRRVYGEAQKTGIARFSSPELMIPSLKGTTPSEVLSELAGHMETEGFVKDAGHLCDLALQREMIISTAIEKGLAFPHVRGAEGGGLEMVLGIHRKGMHFGGPGRNLTRIFFFSVIPVATSAFYLKLLSGLCRVFREKEPRDALLKAKTQEEIWKTLIKTTRKVIK
jgi:mannitol/fructose-specific phosphotransferase system IIA component (Ntr-type)